MAKTLTKAPAQTTKKAAPAPVVEELEEIETDEIENELNEAAEAGTKKEKKAREVKINENQIGVAALAAQLGINGRDLRMFLRKRFRDMTTEKGKTYVWDKTDPQVQEIIDSYTAYKSAPRKKAERVDKEAAVSGETAEEVDLDDLDADDLD